METKLLPYHDDKLTTDDQIILPYTVLKKIASVDPPYFFQLTSKNKIYYVTTLEFSGPLRKVGLSKTIMDQVGKGERLIIKHVKGIKPGKRVVFEVPKEFLDYEFYEQALEGVLTTKTLLSIDQIIEIPLSILDKTVNIKVIELESDGNENDLDLIPNVISIKNIDLAVEFKIIKEEFEQVKEEFDQVKEEQIFENMVCEDNKITDEETDEPKIETLSKEEVRNKRLDYFKKMGVI